MLLTVEALQKILPAAGPRAYLFCEPLNEAMREAGIDTPNEIASFLAQCGHESRHLLALRENCNYSATGLLRTFPRRFDQAAAAAYARMPERIANRAYANRYGNGDEASGDGWNFRGGGLIHLTFRDNYRAAGRALGIDLEGRPELIVEPINAARTAGWFWKVKGLDAEDDDGDASRESRIVNGGAHGLAERQAILDRALKELT